VLAGCPRCGVAPVGVTSVRWPAGVGERRSVYVDEPVRCAAGCMLGPGEVVRVLRGVDAGSSARSVYQLPLSEAAA
jgi:hypothetical protein